MLLAALTLMPAPHGNMVSVKGLLAGQQTTGTLTNQCVTLSNGAASLSTRFLVPGIKTESCRSHLEGSSDGGNNVFG